jgi:hypothetical protein
MMIGTSPIHPMFGTRHTDYITFPLLGPQGGKSAQTIRPFSENAYCYEFSAFSWVLTD